MDIVVDTSVIIAVIANEPEKEALIQHTIGMDMVAPASCHWEIGNAFSAMLRRNRVTIAQAKQAIEAYYSITMRLMDVDLAQALELSNRLGIYAYDSYVIACAISQKCQLITLDQGLARAANAVGVDVLEVTD